MPLIPRAARRSAAGVTRSSAIASRVEHDFPRLRRFLTCPSSVPQDVAERDQPGSSSVEAPKRSAVTPRPSQPEPASDTDVDSDDDTGTAGVVAREWLHSWQPANISGNRQYTMSPRLKKRPQNANLPLVPRQAPKPAKKIVRVKGKGVVQHLKTKVALRFVDKDGRSLFIRKAKSKGHRGLWQLPSVHIHTTDCVHLQGIIIARGFMERVPAQFPLEAHAFMSSRRLGQPMLVMILEARVNCADVQPARCGFKENDFKWVSRSEYEAQCEEMSEILYMRSAWHVRGRTVATFSFHSKPEFEDRQRAILPTEGTFDFENQPYPTQRYFMLFVAAVCVYDEQAGKVLIAKRTKGNPPGQRGKWEWPGGKVDPGETTDETAVREIEEELNLRLDINALTPATFIEKKYFKRNLVIVFYICSKYTGRAKGMERQPVRWVNREELLQCRDNFLEGDDPFTDIVLKVMEKDNNSHKSK